MPAELKYTYILREPGPYFLGGMAYSYSSTPKEVSLTREQERDLFVAIGRRLQQSLNHYDYQAVQRRIDGADE